MGVVLPKCYAEGKLLENIPDLASICWFAQPRYCLPLMPPTPPPNGASVTPSQLEGDSPVRTQGLGFTTAPEASLESSPLPVYLNPIREALGSRGGRGVPRHLMAAFTYRAPVGKIFLMPPVLIGISRLNSSKIYPSHSVLLNSQKCRFRVSFLLFSIAS